MSVCFNLGQFLNVMLVQASIGIKKIKIFFLFLKPVLGFEIRYD